MVSLPAVSSKNVIPFEGIDVPLKYARLFTIQQYPGFEKGQGILGSKHYCIQVVTDTYQDGEIYSYCNYKFSVATLEKARGLVEKLVQANAKWVMWRTSWIYLSPNRVIDLAFCKLSPPAGVVDHSKWGEYFMDFKGVLGLESPDYEVAKVNLSDWDDAIRLTFPDTPDSEEKMKAALRKLDALSDEHHILELNKTGLEFDPDKSRDKPRNRVYDFNVRQTDPDGYNYLPVNIPLIPTFVFTEGVPYEGEMVVYEYVRRKIKIGQEELAEYLETSRW